MKNIPEGKTEEEVVKIISDIVGKLAFHFKFGYFTMEDILQEGFRIGLESLNKNNYDPSRPLENYLFTSIRNGLINFKRDNYKRTDTPCRLCYNLQEGETRHDDKMHCQKYKVWANRNTRKQQVLMPISIDCLHETHKSTPREENDLTLGLEKKEIFEIIDRDLPVEHRSAYLRMKEGASVPKQRRDEVTLLLKEIIENARR